MQDRYQARIEHLFAEAERLSAMDERTIRAAATAQGSLRSGGTIKRVVAAVESRAHEAVVEALANLDREPMRRSRRRDLQNMLKRQIHRHMRSDAIRGLAPKDLEPGDAAAARATTELYDDAEARLAAEVEQHATGFTNGRVATWISAHQTLAFVVQTSLAVIAIIISLIALARG